MKSRSGVLLTCVIGALLIGLAPSIPGAWAADMVVKAPVVPVELPWWTHGYVEFGYRDFVNNPQRDGHIFQGGNSLAKYYEYSTNKPGPFGDFYVATGSGNGLYQIDVCGGGGCSVGPSLWSLPGSWPASWGNVGYSDQRYDAYVSKAGEQYLNLEWDQTPHVYSTSASTLFNTNGNALTLANPNIGQQMFTAGGAGWPITANSPATIAILNTKAAAIGTIINQNVHPTDVGIRRDTASVDYRYTPTDNWDIRANYSNMRRTGSQVDSVLFTATNTGSRVDVAKPIADTTQNFGVNGEYSGTSPWGQKFNAMVGYNGSVYKDDFAGYTVQNPFCNTAGLCAGAPGTPTAALAQMSTTPDNQMNGVSGTVGMDLPLNSRYMGTVSYSGMRQNQQFLPFSINPVALVPSGLPGASLSSLPQQSLNGSINTLLSNNVVTTQINHDLKTKVYYRYYDYDNQTPQLTIQDWIITDAASPQTTGHPQYSPVNPLMVGYIKQNAGAEGTWRPYNSVNLGAAYAYEHYDFTRFDASSTGENTGRVYADWKPEKWVTLRVSGSYGERRAGNYDYLGNVGMFQWPVPRPFPTTSTSVGVTTTILTPFPNAPNYSPAYRQFYLDDRNRAQAKFQVDVDVLRNFTVTPTVNWRDDEFQLSQNQLGLTHDRSLAAGLEMAYAATPDVRFLFSYMNEQRDQNQRASSTYLFPYTTNNVNGGAGYLCPITNGTPITSPPTPNAYLCQSYSANENDRVNTFIVGMSWTPIPQRFDLGFTYTHSQGKNSSPLFMQNGTGPVVSNVFGNNIPAPQFPDVTTTFQRLEANAKYKLDPEFVHGLGFMGDVTLRLRYAWERNSVTNWNTDVMQTYMYQTLNQAQVAYYQTLAGNNPNYNVHMIGGAIAWAW